MAAKVTDSSALSCMTDLASAVYGGRVLFATDEWFAPAHRLLLPQVPVFIPDKFTEFGKWMDGWETRRKRIPGQDWCLVALGLRGTISAVDVDTMFFTGNHSPHVSIQAACFPADKTKWPVALQTLTDNATKERAMGVCATPEQFSLVDQLKSEEWTEIVPFTDLGAGYPETCHNLLKVLNKGPWTHLRINMFPDGGIARLRVYGNVLVDWSQVPETQMLDLVSIEHGGQVVAFNDAHYGHPKNLMTPGRSKSMADGWETARKKNRPPVLKADPVTGLLHLPGKDWVVLKLGHLGVIKQVEVDTNHFKGNFPESCSVYGATYFGQDDAGVLSESVQWRPILPRTKLQAHKQHYFSVLEGTVTLVPEGVNFVKLEIFPSGGISRLRLVGHKKDAASRL